MLAPFVELQKAIRDLTARGEKPDGVLQLESAIRKNSIDTFCSRLAELGSR